MSLGQMKWVSSLSLASIVLFCAEDMLYMNISIGTRQEIDDAIEAALVALEQLCVAGRVPEAHGREFRQLRRPPTGGSPVRECGGGGCQGARNLMGRGRSRRRRGLRQRVQRLRGGLVGRHPGRQQLHECGLKGFLRLSAGRC